MYEGTRGPGKTDAVLMKFAMYVDRGFGAWWRGILFRQTYPQLDEIVVKTRRWFAQAFPYARFNVNEYRWQFPGGETLSLRHMAVPDQYWNYHGHEYPIIIWEELCQWANLDCYQIMKACWRSSYPVMENKPRLPRFYLSTANPYGPGHNAVKNYYIDPAPAGDVIRQEGQEPRVRIHGSIYENKILIEADPNYIKQLEAIEEPNRRAAWLEGSWDITSGGMFDDIWRVGIHYIDAFDIPSTWRIDRTFDWGSSRPFSVGWWALSDGSDVQVNGLGRSYPKGTLFRIREWYGWNGKANEGCGMLSTDIAKGIVRLETEWGIRGRVNDGPADTSIWTTIDGNCIATDMAAVGVTWEPAIKSAGSRKNGWELLRMRLMASRRNEGPGFYVFNTCPQFLRTFPVLPRDAKDPDDVDSSSEDHIGDETRYRALHAERDVTQREMY